MIAPMQRPAVSNLPKEASTTTIATTVPSPEPKKEEKTMPRGKKIRD